MLLASWEALAWWDIGEHVLSHKAFLRTKAFGPWVQPVLSIKGEEGLVPGARVRVREASRDSC